MTKVWILNHYATGMFYSRGGRHYNFAKHLLARGYQPTIFCADRVHNRDVKVELGKGNHVTKPVDGIQFVFVKTAKYRDNGVQRIRNMISFSRNLFSVTSTYASVDGRPDLIIASSVHPLTLVAGIMIAKKLGIPCICEIRDLWPESLVAYGQLKKNNVLAKVLYRGEKWIYQSATRLVFTMEGGVDYIIDKGWDRDSGGPIDLTKVHYINNGVDLETFSFCKDHLTLDDEDLNRKGLFKVVYAGSIRRANNLKKLMDTASVLKKKGYEDIVFLVFGDGTERQALEEYGGRLKLRNVKFKGFVDKNRIPYILSKCDLNIMFFQQNSVKKYGASLNKMFEYFASGKPTLSDCEFGYDLIRKYRSGIVIDDADSEQLADAIVTFHKMPEAEYDEYCRNAIRAAMDFDFVILSDSLEGLILELA